MDCATLKQEKWRACHPTGEAKVGHPRCDANMSLDRLQALHQAHTTCLSYREKENNSTCFTTKDKGHKKAQLIEEQEAMICLDLIHQKSDEIDPDEIEYGTNLEDEDEIDDNEDDEIDPMYNHNEEETASMWTVIGKWILTLIGILAVLYLIRYMV